MTPISAHTVRALTFCALALTSAMACASGFAHVETCLPPDCLAPVALHWPDAFGNSGVEKLIMVLSLACAWLIVWGFFMLLGVSPRRRHPLGMLAGTQARAFWTQQQDERAAEWKAMKADPAKLRATRMTGAVMILMGALVAKGAFMMDPSSPEDLAGATASVQTWDEATPKTLYALRLEPKGVACEMRAGVCAPWGKWSARTDSLVLLPTLGTGQPILRLLPDESRTRYWAKPARGAKLSLMAKVDRKRTPEEAPDGFTIQQTRKFD